MICYDDMILFMMTVTTGGCQCNHCDVFPALMMNVTTGGCHCDLCDVLPALMMSVMTGGCRCVALPPHTACLHWNCHLRGTSFYASKS